MRRTGPLPLLLLLVLAAVLVGTSWVSRESGTAIRLGPTDAGGDVGPWWLDVTVVTGAERQPVANVPLTFLLWLREHPRHMVPVTRTTDAHGCVRLGPLHAPLAEAELEVVARSQRYDVAKRPARAEVVSPEAHTLCATCEVVFLSVVSGRVALPPGVPAEAVVLWRWIGQDFWAQVEVAGNGRFTSHGYGPEAAILEVAAAWQGERGYGRAKVEGGTQDVLLELSDVRPGDPALLHLRVVGPEGKAVTGLVSARLETAFPSPPVGGQLVRGAGPVAFLYEPEHRLEIEVTGIEPGGLGSAAPVPIDVDETELEVHLPRAAAGAGHPGTGIGQRYLSAHVQRPALGVSPHPDLVVRVLDWDFADRGAWACIVRGGGILQHAHLDAEGVARFDHLPNRKGLQVWVARLGGGRYVWRKDLQSGTREIEVRPRVGGTVRGTVRFPQGVASEDWFVHAPGPGMSMNFEAFAVGSFEVRQEGATFEVLGVPPGTWKFGLFDPTEGGGDWVDFEARVGEPVVVDGKAR